MRTRLFAYGTLRKEFNPKPAVDLQGLTYVGAGKVKGWFYDLGDYPGAVEGEGEILGDVFDVRNPEINFKILDDYEGDEFVREKTKVCGINGSEVEAWMYRYNGDTLNLPLINSGDYLAYKKLKDSLR